jgi:ABC-type multidrug transport system permease subunit
MSLSNLDPWSTAEEERSYVLAYSTLATLQALLVLGALTLLFDLHYSWTTLLAIYGVIWLLALVIIALGILISNVARTEGQVFPFIPLVVLPSVLLSGLIIPVASLPLWAQWLSYVSRCHTRTPCCAISRRAASRSRRSGAWSDSSRMALSC